MAAAAASELEGLDVGGIAVSDHAERVPGSIDLVVSGHPVPDERSEAAGRRLLELAATVGEYDLAICLLSGGGSALAEVPAGRLALGDVQTTTDLLLRSGASITDVNTVRQQLSALKGGALARAVRGPLVTLILSDVIGSPLPFIASGPTVPATATPADARDVLRRYHLESSVPAAVVEHLAGKLGWVEAQADDDHVARFRIRDFAAHPERLDEVIGTIAMGRSILER